MQMEYLEGYGEWSDESIGIAGLESRRGQCLDSIQLIDTTKVNVEGTRPNDGKVMKWACAVLSASSRMRVRTRRMGGQARVQCGRVIDIYR